MEEVVEFTAERLLGKTSTGFIFLIDVGLRTARQWLVKESYSIERSRSYIYTSEIILDEIHHLHNNNKIILG